MSPKKKESTANTKPAKSNSKENVNHPHKPARKASTDKNGQSQREKITSETKDRIFKTKTNAKKVIAVKNNAKLNAKGIAVKINTPLKKVIEVVSVKKAATKRSDQKNTAPKKAAPKRVVPKKAVIKTHKVRVIPPIPREK